MFLKISETSQENISVGVSKVPGPQTCNFIKKWIRHRCFHVKLMKFLRTTILKNISERLLLSYQKIRDSVMFTRTQTIHAALTCFFHNKMWYFFPLFVIVLQSKLQNTAVARRDFLREIRSGVYWFGMEWLFRQKTVVSIQVFQAIDMIFVTDFSHATLIKKKRNLAIDQRGTGWSNFFFCKQLK